MAANQPTSQPDLLIRLHRSKLDGDPAADERIAETLVPLLVLRLRRRWPRVGLDAVVSAAHDVVLWYLAAPSHYDGASARLDVFLGHVAHRRLQDSSRHDRRRQAHEVSLRPAERQVAMASHERQVSARKEDAGPVATRLRVMALARTDLEREFLHAYLREDDGPSPAAVLKIEHLSATEQARAVHGVIKRLRQRVIRSTSRFSR